MDVNTLLSHIQMYQVHHNLRDFPDNFLETPVKILLQVGDGMLHLAELKGMFTTSCWDTLVLTTVNPTHFEAMNEDKLLQVLQNSPAMRYCKRCKRALRDPASSTGFCVRCNQILLRELEPTFGDGSE